MIRIVDVFIGSAKFHTREELTENEKRRSDKTVELNRLVEQGYEIIDASPMTVGISGMMVYTLQKITDGE